MIVIIFMHNIIMFLKELKLNVHWYNIIPCTISNKYLKKLQIQQCLNNVLLKKSAIEEITKLMIDMDSY